MELILHILFLTPRRLLVCTFGFLVIVNALVIRHSVDVVQPQIHTVTIQKSPQESQTPKILRKLREHLNFKPPGDGTNKWKKPVPILTGGHLSNDNLKSEHLQALVMVSFYMGYVVTQMLADLLSAHFGGRGTLTTALTFTAFFMLISAPLVSNCGLNGLIVINLLLGLAEGPVFPAFRCIMTAVTRSEAKSFPDVLILSSGHIGILLVNLLSEILFPSFQWSLAFYFLGGCAFFWFFCFIVFCCNGLKFTPYIDVDENHDSQQSVAYSSDHVSQELPTTRSPTWSLLSATIQYDGAQRLMISELRKIFAEFRHSNCWHNGCSCLKILFPFFLNWLVSILWGFFNDILLNWNILTLSESREMTTMLGELSRGGQRDLIVQANLGSRICTDFISCLVSNENKTFTTVFNCMMAVMGSYYADIKMNSVESPNWISSAMAVAKEFGSITNIIAPYISNLDREEELVQNQHSLLWLIVTMFKHNDIETFVDQAQIRENTAPLEP